MRTRSGLLLLAAVLVLSACSPGSQQSPPATPTAEGILEGQPTTTPPSPAAAAEPQTTADLVSYIQAGDPVDLAAYGDMAFTTPSDNISCGVYGPPSDGVLCFIKENSWPPVVAPACNDFGDWLDYTVTTSADGVRRGDCFSEQPFPMPSTVLPYGSTISVGAVACRSESAFLACAHLTTGNGFVIARTIFHTYGTVQPPHGN